MCARVAWEPGDAATAADGGVWADPLVRLLQAELAVRGGRITELEDDNARLREESQRLRSELEETRRAGKRQAASFSRGERKPNPGRGGRKPGPDYGAKARRLPPPPEQVDQVVEVGLPKACPDCGGQVALDKVIEQLQEELVPAHSRMRRYDIALGHCNSCKRRVRSRHPEQTSNALGAAGVMLGARAHALAAWLHIGLGVPMAKTSKILAALGGLSVTPGGLHSALHKTAGDAETTYQALLEALRRSEAVAADETGWRIDGERAWLWTYVGDAVTVYDIAPGRGYDQAKAILGEDFSGVIERDGWTAYRKFAEATHQTCLAHLLRRCRELGEVAVGGQARVPGELRRILLDALATRDQRLEGEALTEAVAALAARIDAFCQHQCAHEPNRRLVKHVTAERDHLLTFLTHPGVQATNWEAEQALRGMIVNRKNWGGNKTRQGADTAAVLASVLRTAIQQGVDPIEALAEIQRTGQIPAGLVLACAGRSP